LDWLAAGITRVSLGVQSVDDDTLRALGRDHDGARARAALERVSKSRLRTFSADLIFGASAQGEIALRRDVDVVSALAPHVSTYCLTYEPGTQLYNLRSKGKVHALSPDDEADRYDIVRDAL